MSPEKNLTALKTLVFSMGIVLVIGFLVVAASVWLKMKAGSPAAKSAVAGGVLPANCPGGTVDLKGRGHVVDTSIEGSTLRLALAKAGGELEMVHVDMCSGKETSALKIMTDTQ